MKCYYCYYNVLTAEIDALAMYGKALDRLLDDVAVPMQYYRNTGHGNWAAIRMMAPIIEAFAKNDPKRRNTILKDIGIDYPEVFWAMYRHGLMHNDSAPQSIQCGDKAVG